MLSRSFQVEGRSGRQAEKPAFRGRRAVSGRAPEQAAARSRDQHALTAGRAPRLRRSLRTGTPRASSFPRPGRGEVLTTLW